jgi:hypothetical protein
MLFAHERWFEFEPVSSDWGFVTETSTLVLLGCAVAITLAVRFIARFWPGKDIDFLARLVPWMPFAIRIHLAVSMVGLLSLGYYLSPAMDLPPKWWSFLYGAVMVIVAITMATGWYAREGALLLVIAGPLGIIAFGWYFGANELMGHLPIYVTLLAVLVYGSSPQFRPAVSALLPSRFTPSRS